MTETFRITETNPYLSREEEWPGLTLEEAAHRMDDLTGVGADVILSDFDEDCVFCGGRGERGTWVNELQREMVGSCHDCHRTGKRRDPWEYVDPETGREVVMRREVE